MPMLRIVAFSAYRLPLVSQSACPSWHPRPAESTAFCTLTVVALCYVDFCSPPSTFPSHRAAWLLAAGGVRREVALRYHCKPHVPQVLRLQRQLGEVHGSDANSLRRAYAALVQHVQALKDESQVGNHLSTPRCWHDCRLRCWLVFWWPRAEVVNQHHQPMSQTQSVPSQTVLAPCHNVAQSRTS